MSSKAVDRDGYLIEFIVVNGYKWYGRVRYITVTTAPALTAVF